MGLIAGLVWGGAAMGMTTDGTMITNVASSTYGTTSGIGFNVTYSVTALTWVANPCLQLQKTGMPVSQASGNLVTYTIWVVNCSCTGSAFNLSITDRLPDNVGFGAGGSAWNGGSGGTWFPANGSDNVTWGAGLPGAGQVAPYYLRFSLNLLGPCKSAMESYTVTVL